MDRETAEEIKRHFNVVADSLRNDLYDELERRIERLEGSGG